MNPGKPGSAYQQPINPMRDAAQALERQGGSATQALACETTRAVACVAAKTKLTQS
jgi:hypothetical protein